MLKAPPFPKEPELRRESAEYATSTEDLADSFADIAPLDALRRIREILVQKRRYFAKDAINYPIVYMTRSQDIFRIQELLHAIDTAIADEIRIDAP